VLENAFSCLNDLGLLGLLPYRKDRSYGIIYVLSMGNSIFPYEVRRFPTEEHFSARGLVPRAEITHPRLEMFEPSGEMIFFRWGPAIRSK
jgi:hypothetical protein